MIPKINLAFLGLVCIMLITSCDKKKESPKVINLLSNQKTSYNFDISVTQLDKNNAPALQSFAHGINDDYWILLSGRTNNQADDGGIHNMNSSSNYSTLSFPPESFNTDIHVYNLKEDKVNTLSLDSFVKAVSNNINSQQITDMDGYIDQLTESISRLRCTNPLITQHNDFLYIIGGYGTDIDSTNVAVNYQTFNTVTRIHLPSLLKIFNGTPISDWDNFYRVGANDMLKSTGGEVHMIENTLYLCGGHNFGKGARNGQQYVDAVIPFTVSNNPADKITLDINVLSPITDVPIDSLGTTYADENSKFRRRDGPMVPILVEKRSGYAEGVAFLGGVFQPGRTLKAWNDGLYVTPDINTLNNQLINHKLDTAYNQSNCNVYSCPDFAVASYGEDGVLRLHTFLPGGIGDGSLDGNLSGFSNTHTQSILNTRTLTSTAVIDKTNLYGGSNFYGAEAAFIPIQDNSVVYFNSSTGLTPFIDASSTFSISGGSKTIGYIFGGIEAYQVSPAKSPSSGYGPGKSAASNIIWAVTLTASPEK